MIERLRRLFRRRRPLAPEDPARMVNAVALSAELHNQAARLTAIADELAAAHGIDRRWRDVEVPHPGRRADDT